jgi:hypothetical protein
MTIRGIAARPERNSQGLWISLTDFGVRLVTPMLADTSPQARAGEGFDAEQASTDWQRRYARRAGVESTIAQAVKVTDARRARYRGLPKVCLEHHTMAAALNLIRLDAWFNGEVLDPRRTTHLARLELALAA